MEQQLSKDKKRKSTWPSTGPESGVKMDFTAMVGEGFTRGDVAGGLLGLKIVTQSLT